METVSTTDSPSRNNGDHDLGHGPDETLNLEDMEPPEPCRINALCTLVLVAVLASDALVTP
jgi:hypothetical protein